MNVVNGYWKAGEAAPDAGAKAQAAHMTVAPFSRPWERGLGNMV